MMGSIVWPLNRKLQGFRLPLPSLPKWLALLLLDRTHRSLHLIKLRAKVPKVASRSGLCARCNHGDYISSRPQIWVFKLADSLGFVSPQGSGSALEPLRWIDLVGSGKRRERADLWTSVQGQAQEPRLTVAQGSQAAAGSRA